MRDSTTRCTVQYAMFKLQRYYCLTFQLNFNQTLGLHILSSGNIINTKRKCDTSSANALTALIGNLEILTEILSDKTNGCYIKGDEQLMCNMMLNSHCLIKNLDWKNSIVADKTSTQLSCDGQRIPIMLLLFSLLFILDKLYC
jgi:hypothetical protein